MCACVTQALTPYQDSTKFIRAQDVLSIYKEIVKQCKCLCLLERRARLLTHTVGKLTTVREDRSEGSTNMSTPIPAGFEPNRVDTIIADVFSLISLMFLTVGKSRESPAIYGQIASMRVRHRRSTPLRLYTLANALRSKY